MRNEWVVQTIGEKILLGFQGNNSFVEQSLNFIFNYEVVPSEARVQTLGCDRFKFVSTNITKLESGLEKEGQVLKVWELCKQCEDPENFKVDNHSEEIKLAGQTHREKVMKSIRNEVFYHYEGAESFLPTYAEPNVRK